MPFAVVNGTNIYDELIGEGQPVVLSTGGRTPGRILQPLAEAMAANCRVLLYDRRNTGRSDISIAGEGSESDICLEDLHALLGQLDISPAYVGGFSWGCGLSLLLATRHSEHVKGLLLFGPGGGSTTESARITGRQYGDYIEAARQGGMEAVAATPYFSDLIKEYPPSRGPLLALDPGDFIAAMARWRDHNIRGAPMFVAPGLTEKQIRQIRVPAIIVPGSDEAHSPAQGKRLHELIRGSELAPYQVSFFPARPGQWEKLAVTFLDFIERHEPANHMR